MESGIIEECIKNSESEVKDNLLRAECLSLITEIWLLNPSLIEENERKIDETHSILHLALKMLKRGCRDANRPLRISTLGLMFRLLDRFAATRNP